MTRAEKYGYENCPNREGGQRNDGFYVAVIDGKVYHFNTSDGRRKFIRKLEKQQKEG